MPSTRLVTLLGAAIRQQRHLRELSQCELAELTGVSQAAVARIESGNRAPSIGVLEALLAAMDVQLVVGVEPLDAHLDARIDDLAARSIGERIDELGLDRLLDQLPDFPQVLTGSAAALFRARRCLSTRWRSPCGGRTRNCSPAGWRRPTASGGTRAGASSAACGWNPRSRASIVGRPATARSGPRCATSYPKRSRYATADADYRVVPLVELELTEPRAGELLRRYRARQLASGG